MARLTEAQRKLLEAAGARTIMVSAWSGSVCRQDGGFVVGVNKQTFNSLALRGYLAKSGASVGTDFYSITDAGRAALEAEDHG